MATNGRKFLRLSKAHQFALSLHAKERLEEHAGFSMTTGLAHALFNGSRQLNYEEMYLLGYRPNYKQRLQQGVRSWYFLFRVFAQELVAVVTEDAEPGNFIWVTTYAPNRQVAWYRLIDSPALESAAA